MVATLANNIPMFGMMKNMDTRGKVINCAFAVSAAFALGDRRFCRREHERHDLPDDCRQVDWWCDGDWRSDDAGAKDENVPAVVDAETAEAKAEAQS